MDNVCIYLRKSREDEELEKAYGEGETLIKHRKALLRYAKDNNLNIVKIYEEVVSGEKLIHRPAMLELLADVEKGLYGAVLCMDIQRLGRGDMQDQGLVLNTFKNSKTKIITLRKTFDLNDEFDEEYSEFEAFMSRKEYKMITRRMQGGRIRSVQDGNYIATRPPYGYMLLETKQSRTLTPHPDQADVVKLIFDMYTNKGMGVGRIANELNKLGIPSYTGRTWERTLLTSMLKNQIYVGKVTWKKKCIRKSTTPGKSKDAYTRPKNEWIIADGKHPALVDVNTFAQAQEILEKKYHVPYQITNGLQNPLAGLIICGKCGAKMKRRPYSHGGAHLICEHCGNKSSRFEHVERRVIEALEDWLKAYELDLELESEQQTDSLQLQTYKKSLVAMEKELDELKTQKLRLHDLLEQGVYTVEVFLERSNNIAGRSKAISESMAELTSKIADEEKRLQTQDNILPQIKIVLDLYRKSTNTEEKNTLIKSVLDKAIYTKEKYQKDDDFTITIYPRLIS